MQPVDMPSYADAFSKFNKPTQKHTMKNFLKDKIIKLPATVAPNIDLETLQNLQKIARVTHAAAQRAEANCDYSTASIEALETHEETAKNAFNNYNAAFHNLR